MRRRAHMENTIDIIKNGLDNHTKHHMLWHIAHMARWINPRAHWCYDFEDFVGDVIVSAKSCIAGTPMTLIGSKVMQFVLLVLQLGISTR